MACGVGCGWSALSHVAQHPFSGPLEGWKALRGGGWSGKALTPLCEAPSASVRGCAAGVVFTVPLPSLRVFQPFGCWWVLPCAIASLFERLLFLPAGIFRLAVLLVLALGCCPWLPLPFGDRLLSFGWGVTSAGSWSPLGCAGCSCLIFRQRRFGVYPSVFVKREC